ncbi:MAG: AMP-binding protein, partial [Promethearchaeota archaeon]
MTIKYKVSEDRPFYKGKFWPKGVPHQLDYDYSLTVGRMLEETAAKYPDDPVMWFLDGWTSYKEFNDLVDRFATYLASIGVKKGDVVAVYLANCPQYVVCYYATVKIGAIITGINPTYQSLEVLHQFKLTKPKVLLALDALYFHYVTKIEKDYAFDKVIITNLVDQGTGLSGLKKWLGKLLKK